MDISYSLSYILHIFILVHTYIGADQLSVIQEVASARNVVFDEDSVSLGGMSGRADVLVVTTSRSN